VATGAGSLPDSCAFARSGGSSLCAVRALPGAGPGIDTPPNFPSRGSCGAVRLTRITLGWHSWRVNDQSFPVTVLVRRPDGSTESVRVGTAVRAGDGFQLRLGELSIGLAADPAPSRSSREAPSGDRGMVFPPYGRSKGAPIAGASIQDLEYYIAGSRRSLDDPSKSRWHDKERSLLAAMEAELARQRGGGGPGQAGSTAGDASYASDAPPDEYDGSAFPDDDIPF